MIAQSTFFMEQEHGRARVFNQWGDDDETIKSKSQYLLGGAYYFTSWAAQTAHLSAFHDVTVQLPLKHAPWIAFITSHMTSS